jgi:phosphatidate cytidylyltransferase
MDQFEHFARTLAVIHIIPGQTYFAVDTIIKGIIWFLIPIVLVIANNFFAFVFGITFSCTHGVKLSPKKRMTDFLQSLLCTIMSGYLSTSLMLQSRYFTCPCNVKLLSYSF